MAQICGKCYRDVAPGAKHCPYCHVDFARDIQVESSELLRLKEIRRKRDLSESEALERESEVASN